MVTIVLGGAILFSYKVGVEAKDAVVTLKTHVEQSRWRSLKFSQWLEGDNTMYNYIDSHMASAYDTLVQKVYYQYNHPLNHLSILPIVSNDLIRIEPS